MSFRYQAFISYSSKDQAVARWLHHGLETYRIPRALVGRPGRDEPVPRNLFPVFRDRDELPLSSDLGATIQDALKASRFLIVICSPAAARSRWVNEEVRAFKSLGRSDRIFALIASGVPNGSDDPSTADQECFPEALLHEFTSDGIATGRRTEPIGGDLRPEGDGRQAAFLKAVAGIIGVGYDALAQREVKRRRKTQAILAMLCLAALLAGIYLWDYNRTQVEYYAALADRWGVPSGIVPLSSDTVRHRATSYRVESSQHKVRRIERVNSVGELRDDPALFGAALQEVHYRENGQVSRVDLSGHNGQSIVRKVFDEREPGERSQTVEFQRKFKDQPFSISIASGTDTIARRTGITAESLEFDAEGRTTSIGYLDNYRNASADNAGTWGLAFQYAANRLPVEITNLDNDGKPLPNHSGIVRRQFVYDAQANLVQESNLDANGRPSLGDEGFAWAKRKYDPFGNMIEEATYGPRGNPILCLQGYARRVQKYDSAGREIERDYFGNDGRPILGARGFARALRQYDDFGNVVEEADFDAAGRPILCDKGYAVIKIQSDERGNKTREEYFGTDGFPILRKDSGMAVNAFKYDSHANLVEEDYFGVDGRPILRKDAGAARIVWKFDQRDNEIEEDDFGVDGRPILCDEGFARLTMAYDDRGNEIEEDEFGKDGKPIVGVNGYARLLRKYDARGNEVEEDDFGADGLPTLGAKGFAVVKMKCDDRGNVIEQACFGLDGRPIADKEGIASEKWIYDQRGNLVEDGDFGLDGRLVIGKGEGYAYAKHEYDESGRKTADYYFDASHRPWPVQGAVRQSYIYDNSGHLTETARFDARGRKLK